MTETTEGTTGAKIQQKGENIKPDVQEDYVPSLVWRAFGLKVCKTKELPSYDDKNFFVKVEDSYENKYLTEIYPHGYVLKILNSLDTQRPTYIEAQHAVLQHLRDNGLAVQEPVPSVEGKDYSLENIPSEGQDERRSCVNLVRLVKFVPGSILHDVPYVPETHFNIGKFCGQMHQALKNFHHPFYDTFTTLWSLSHVPKLSEFSFAIQEDDNRQRVEDTVAAFKSEVIPLYSKLQTGIIHGDINEQNLLMSEVKGQDDVDKDKRVYDVCGLLDFQDVTNSYPIFDVAICIAYISIDTPVSWQLDAGGHFLAGFLQYCKLNETDMDVLKTCVCARLSQSLCLGAYTYHIQQGNTYVLTTAQKGWPLLKRFIDVPKQELYQRWRSIIESYTSK